MKKIVAIIIACVLSMAATAGAEEGMTKAQGDIILKELREIRALLEKQRAPSPPGQPEPVDATVSVDGPTLGKKGATLTLVEFTDYECPYCKRFYDSTFLELKKKYIDTGKLKFVSRNLPLPFHNNAKKAAQAALCAGGQGKYWEMRDVIFKNNRNLGSEKLIDYAGELKLDLNKFNACLNSNKHLDKIDADLNEARSVAISGTPTFVLGKTVKKGKMTGEKVIGAQPYTVFEEKIEILLAEAKKK